MRDLADLKVENYASAGDFLKYVENSSHGISRSENPDPYRLLILDLEALPSKPFQWISSAMDLLKSKGQSGGHVPTRVLLLSFQDGAHSPENLRSEQIDDLVLKPLDRSLFLQKVEILISETGQVMPSFLFRQSTKQVIEIGKDGVIDEISEFGVAIRNPTPLVEGLFAALHSEVFGAGADGRLLARVYESVRHPSLEGEYLVRFSYFGLNERQSANIKKFVRSRQVSLRTRHSGGSSKVKRTVAATGPPTGLHRFAVIDMNPTSYPELKSALEGSFNDVIVDFYPSYARLLQAVTRFMPSESREEDVETSSHSPSPSFAEEAHVSWPTDPLVLIVTGQFHELVRFEGTLQPEDLILGHRVEDWLARPTSWLTSVDREDLAEVEELLAYVATGAKGYGAFRMIDQERNVIYLEARGALEKTGEADGGSLLRLELKKIERENWLQISESSMHQHRGPETLRYDAIFVDGAVLRSDPSAWWLGLSEMLGKASVVSCEAELPKIFVMIEEGSRLRPEGFRVKGITDFSFKPLERKAIVEKIAAFFPRLERKQPLEVPPSVHCELPVHLAKDVLMNELAEYGLTVLHPTPFREKTFMRFFSDLFGQGHGVIGRCIHCEKDKEQNAYHCHFTFYGPSDEFLSRIRAWVREDYVHKKKT